MAFKVHKAVPPPQGHVGRLVGLDGLDGLQSVQLGIVNAIISTRGRT
jgi:hypothetical protein